MTDMIDPHLPPRRAGADDAANPRDPRATLMPSGAPGTAAVSILSPAFRLWASIASS